MANVDAARAESVFSAALEHAAGPERQAYLADACGDDAKLRARVEDGDHTRDGKRRSRPSGIALPYTYEEGRWVFEK